MVLTNDSINEIDSVHC